MSRKQCITWSDAAKRSVWSDYTLFAQVYLPYNQGKYGDVRSESNVTLGKFWKATSNIS